MYILYVVYAEMSLCPYLPTLSHYLPIPPSLSLSINSGPVLALKHSKSTGMYTAAYPDKVEKCVAIDGLLPFYLPNDYVGPSCL